MIFRNSIPADNPQFVADVIAEIWALGRSISLSPLAGCPFRNCRRRSKYHAEVQIIGPIHLVDAADSPF